MSAWRKVGITYSTYITICANILRLSLKENLKTTVILNRSNALIGFNKFDKGVTTDDPIILQNK